MSIAIDILVSYDVTSLTELEINDASVFTSPNVIGNVNGVRMLFSTVESTQSHPTNVQELLAWHEYEVQSGSTTINGITYSAGDKILLSTDTTPTGTFVIDATGRYGGYISNQLPYQGLPYVFTPSMVGAEPLNNLYFSDQIFTLDYEYYTTKYQVGDTLPAGQYLAVGTIGDTAVLGTKTVYVGEIIDFAGGTFDLGNAELVLYNSENRFNFATIYQSFQVYEAYLQAKANAIYPDPVLESNLLDVAALLATIEFSAGRTSGYSLVQLQDNLNRIINYYGANI